MLNLPKQNYDIILADPPWSYKQSGRGAAKNHYKTMSTSDICQLPVRNIATERALLFLWATFPNIKEAFKVMTAWGFEYKTVAFVWIKKNKKATDTLFWGGGFYTRANSEVCLLGISKGTRATEIIKSRSVHQIIEAPVSQHSEKPYEAKERIIELVGDLPRIELFARSEVEFTDGWHGWGLEYGGKNDELSDFSTNDSNNNCNIYVG